MALLWVIGAATGAAAQDQPKEPIPAVTDADREAVFPMDLHGHTLHDRGWNFLALFDQLEWHAHSRGSGLLWDNKNWVGGDRNRVWVRSEGESKRGKLEDAEAHVLFGRAVSPWWDVVAGVRQDFRPGPARTWAAIGMQGLAPQWFDVEATAYVGASGRTAARLEVEYELRLTNRLTLQPLVELNVFGKSDPERGIGAGLSTGEVGVRVRYEIRREVAPYLGLVWHRKFFGTADAARTTGGDVGGLRAAAGVRMWF